jgi:hypothetical protein
LEKQTENAEDSTAAAQRAEFAAVVFIIIFPGGSAPDWTPAKNSSLSLALFFPKHDVSGIKVRAEEVPLLSTPQLYGHRLTRRSNLMTLFSVHAPPYLRPVAHSGP